MGQGMFKVGDEVIVSNPKSKGYQYFKGVVGVVAGMSPIFNGLVMVDFHSSGSISFFEDELAHAKNKIVTDILNDL